MHIRQSFTLLQGHFYLHTEMETLYREREAALLTNSE